MATNRRGSEISAEVAGVVAELEHVEATISVARERAKALRDQAEKLEATMLRMARGTGDVTAAAAQAVAQVVKETEQTKTEDANVENFKAASLAEQIEQHLRRRIMTTSELSRAVGAPVDEVVTQLKQLKGKVTNLGTPSHARWSWRVGSEAQPQELRGLIERLIQFQPMEFRELVHATGAREGLVQGHLVEIRKVNDVLDFGTPGRARWFLMPGKVRHAKLKKRSRE